MGSALAHTPSFPATTGGWLALAAIALACTVGAVLSFFGALRRLGATPTATISTFEPVVTVLLAAVVLGEEFSGPQWAGAALVVAVVLVVASGRVERPVAGVAEGVRYAERDGAR
ncbi:EamA family transporter [Crossiella cryophila]|uniref:EamA family transporter n=1 Tax=Crossiella cryophila TaxID=43355 RepID=UPI0031E98FED